MRALITVDRRAAVVADRFFVGSPGAAGDNAGTAGESTEGAAGLDCEPPEPRSSDLILKLSEADQNWHTEGYISSSVASLGEPHYVTFDSIRRSSTREFDRQWSGG